MIKILPVILLSLFTANVFAGSAGYIGTHDDRKYADLSDPEYRGVVKLTIGGSRCTGSFISPNLILTNDHCALECIDKDCGAEWWNGSNYEKSDISEIALYNKNYETLDGKDWAILVSDKNSKFYNDISSSTTNGMVSRGGFGTLRIIEDSEIPYLKQLYMNTVNNNQECKSKKGYWERVDCVNFAVNKKLKDEGKKPLLRDSNNFKVQRCSILGPRSDSPKMVRTDCDSSGGDSGAPLLRGNTIVAINNSGQQQIFGDSSENANAVKTENFYKYAKETIAEYKTKANANNTSTKANSNNANTTTTNNNTSAKPSNKTSTTTTNNTSTKTNSNNASTTTTNNNTLAKPSNNIVFVPLKSNQNNEQQNVEQIVRQRLQDFDCD